jgi:hypothetical protein
MKKVFCIGLLLTVFSCGKELLSTEVDKQNSKNEETVTKVTGMINKGASNKNKDSFIYPIEAKSKHEYVREEDTLYASINGYHYSVYTDGRIKEESSIKTFKLQNKDIIEKAYLHQLDDNLLVYYTETDSEVAGSKVELINRKTGWVIYTNDIWGFNLGQPIIKGKKSYVTSIGFVGKLDLKTGKYDWKHNNLYDHQKYSFNNFDSISIGLDTVAFISVHHKNKTTDKVLVADKTGQLLKIIK